MPSSFKENIIKIIKPITFQESQLISTTAVNADANWSSATTYAVNAVVTYASKRWKSLQASNLNKQPDLNPTWWLDLGADNKHAMFDSIVGTSTTATTSLTTVVAPAALFDSIALINVDAAVVKITIRDGVSGPIVYQNTAGLNDANIANWYDYFFTDPLLKRTQVVFTNIPKYLNAYITLELTNSTGVQVSLAQFIYGNLEELGTTQYGARAGMIDYSVKKTDEFGNITFVERAYSKRLTAEFFVLNANLNRVQSYLYSIRATPSVFVASDNPTFEEALVVYGFIRDFTTEISYPSHSMCSIEVEGLT